MVTLSLVLNLIIFLHLSEYCYNSNNLYINKCCTSKYVELAAAILTCEEADLDTKITEILNEVDATSSQPPSWFQRQPAPDLPKDVGSISMADTVRELSELSSLDARGAPDIAHVLNRHLDQKQGHATSYSKR